ncbi:unnamed protein product [Notodromas monacha]|uniref:Trimeric intracellular cation channel type B n=1 Tax=Notodromas monacha TaxID=399045 RepID=A0A7R9BS79_9CRUS|nr:unnamed protein product [Notodromas monacha]CAG0919355.1 unnamed protein product [Notodromas monacha]
MLGNAKFSRLHPFACWISCMISIFSGSLLTAFLLGEPLLSVFKTSDQLYVATAVWYMVFYAPFDVGYYIVSILPVKCVLAVMKEVYRCKKINDGVVHASRLYPQGYLPILIVGTLKGNGGNFMKVMERLCRGIWTPDVMETLRPSAPTKLSALAAAIFLVKEKTELISAPHHVVYFGIMVFLVYFKLSSLLLGIHDPLAPFENLGCTIFLGGIPDHLGVPDVPLKVGKGVVEKQQKKKGSPGDDLDQKPQAPSDGSGDASQSKSKAALKPPASPKPKETPKPKPAKNKKKD